MSMMTVPPFRPIHPGDHKLSRPTRITKLRDDDPVTVVAVPAFAALPQSIAKVPTYSNRAVDPQVLQSLLNNPNNRRVSVSNLLFWFEAGFRDSRRAQGSHGLEKRLGNIERKTEEKESKSWTN